MKGYINRLFGWGHQPAKTAKEVGKPPGSKAEYLFPQYADPVFNRTLFNSRMELLKFLVEKNKNGAADKEINDLLQALMVQVKVYEPPDTDAPIEEFDIEHDWSKEGE